MCVWDARLCASVCHRLSESVCVAEVKREFLSEAALCCLVCVVAVCRLSLCLSLCLPVYACVLALLRQENLLLRLAVCVFVVVFASLRQLTAFVFVFVVVAAAAVAREKV